MLLYVCNSPSNYFQLLPLLVQYEPYAADSWKSISQLVFLIFFSFFWDFKYVFYALFNDFKSFVAVGGAPFPLAAPYRPLVCQLLFSAVLF